MESNWSDIKILIVEDIESSILFFTSAIKRTGATILTAVNGKEAIEAVKNNPDIDIILMDIHMPEMNGLEATSTIKSINPNISIIIQTAYVMDYSAEVCIKAGCDTYIVKPVNIDTLFKSINDLIKKK
jgi:CheY-like chemotaxis protein|tara:strand:- start:794 stop:1177 length:384 start_codon:yes stop_codon:yes gene_type:complete